MSSPSACQACRTAPPLDFDFTMAFQPILDTTQGKVWGYEALVRGKDGEGAGEVLSRVTAQNRYQFDQSCRVKAIELAAKLFPANDALLSINFMPNAVYQPEACIRTSMMAAKRSGFDPRRLMFELTESEEIEDVGHVKRILSTYKKLGFTTAIDDFGAGFSGLNLLADFQPDILKLDMALVRNIHESRARQAIVAGISHIARELDIRLIAEGIELEEEFTVLRAAGISLFQGYLFARPGFQSLPAISKVCDIEFAASAA